MDKKFKKTYGIIGLSASILLLSACGSSDKSMQTGQLIDAAVAGVSYTTSPGNQSGITDSQGNYNFLPGDKVTFKIGKIVFPTVSAKGTVTPLDIASSTDVNNTTVVNIARLLQSLDSDSDTSNGITIDSSVTGSAYDFTQSEADFEAAFKADFPNLNLITKADAITHLESELAKVNSGNGSSGDLKDGEEVAKIPSEIVGTYTVKFSESKAGSGIVDGSSQKFEVKADGSLVIGDSKTLTNPVLYNGNTAQAIWFDNDAKLAYRLTDLKQKKFTEINVASNVHFGKTGFIFYGQYSNKEKPAKIKGLISYNISGLPSGAFVTLISGAKSTINTPQSNGFVSGTVSLASDSSYNIVVKATPSGIVCTPVNGSGIMPRPAKDFTIDINCVDNRPK